MGRPIRRSLRSSSAGCGTSRSSRRPKAAARPSRPSRAGRLGDGQKRPIDLLPAARPLLARIATLAAALPDCRIEVAGHTDDVPIHTGAFPSNLELSLARAARVVRELGVASPGLDGRMIATGFGEHRPVVPNGDAAARAQNRRVEIRFVPRDRGRPETS